jgi:Ca-activated chloride channel homolog
MFRFEHPEFLWAFGAIPVLIGFFITMIKARKRAIQRFGEEGLLLRLMPEFSQQKHTVKFIILMVALLFFIIAWANPQWGTKKQKVKRESVDVFIALDVSQSMMAEDITPNRMERAKKFVSNLTDALKGNRIGTIVFAGNAYLQMPLTTDYSAVKIFAKSANTDMTPTQGTAIGEAIQLVIKSFERDDKHQKAMIVITDGEDHEDEAIKLANEAAGDGIVIFTVGVGTVEGGTIPALDEMTGTISLKRDVNGDVVQSKLNEQMLRDIAEEANGNYFNLQDQEKKIISEIADRVGKLEKREFEQRIFEEYDSYFQYFLAFGLLLFVAEFMLDFRKSRWWWVNKDIFKV